MKKLQFNKHNLILFFLLLVLFVLLVNPDWFPFLPDELRLSLKSHLHRAFGQSDASPWFLSLARFGTLAAALSLLYALFLAVRFVLSRIQFKTSRGRTVASLVLSLVQYTALAIGLLWGLSILGVNTNAVLASVGILGLVLGLGAQSLIADVLAGVSLLFEGHYAVGDVVIFGDFRGRVCSMGVRTTVIEDVLGNSKIVNNSDLRNFISRAQALSAVTCDVSIGYDQPLAPVEALLRAALPSIQETYPALFPEVPVYMGVEALADSAVVLRVLAYVDEMDTIDARRALNRELKLLFDKNSISFPFPQLDVHLPEATAGEQNA